MNTLDLLATLLGAVRDDPTNFEKQAAYYKALADARLTDYYTLSDVNQEFKRAFDIIADIANSYADGHDEINEYTPDAYIKLLEGYLGRISVLSIRAYRGEFPVDE